LARERVEDWGFFERRGREGFAENAEKKIQNKAKKNSTIS
jgi:hypothetical protein